MGRVGQGILSRHAAQEDQRCPSDQPDPGDLEDRQDPKRRVGDKNLRNDTKWPGHPRQPGCQPCREQHSSCPRFPAHPRPLLPRLCAQKLLIPLAPGRAGSDEALTEGPSSPGSPFSPGAPAGPWRPGSPARPGGPLSPRAPLGPSFPEGPGGPGGPGLP